MDMNEILFDFFTFSETGDPVIDRFMYWSTAASELVSVIVLLLFLFLNPSLRSRKRTEDRIMFGECMLVILMMVTDLVWDLSVLCQGAWVRFVVTVASILIEFFYMVALLLWVVFVDYSLYRSEDHIRRRYRYAPIPIIAVMSLVFIQSIIIYSTGDITENVYLSLILMRIMELLVELLYILKAFHLSYTHGKESREPGFLRLGAFLIPFVLGLLFRVYAGFFLTLGIILTYGAVRNRDRFLDRATGLYNRNFLDYLSRYRDRKKYAGENGILISAKGHGEDMSKLLMEVKPAGSTAFALGGDCFLLLSESLRGSAARMAVETIAEAAEASESPYWPDIRTARQDPGESAGDFALRLLKELEGEGEKHA